MDSLVEEPFSSSLFSANINEIVPQSQILIMAATITSSKTYMCARGSKLQIEDACESLILRGRITTGSSSNNTKNKRRNSNSNSNSNNASRKEEKINDRYNNIQLEYGPREDDDSLTIFQSPRNKIVRIKARSKRGEKKHYILNF